MPEWSCMAAHSSAIYLLHHYFEWGFKMVWVDASMFDVMSGPDWDKGDNGGGSHAHGHSD